jgi:ADP-ribose pyrophosphatase YjhB (NUDIX family)
MKPDYPLSKEEFDAIYSKVVRLSVEVLIYEKGRGVFLTKRDIEPCKGQWHLPGGTVVFGEPVKDTVKRIAKRELDVDIKESHLVGYIDFPSHYENGLDSPVSMVFEVDKYEGTPRFTTEATDGQWFTTTPKNMHADQDAFLLGNGYLSA